MPDTHTWTAYIAGRDDAHALRSAAERIADFTGQEVMLFARLHTAPSNEELAASLHISVRTVKFHVANMRRKLGDVSRLQLCLLAALRDLDAATRGTRTPCAGGTGPGRRTRRRS
ncbi:LuxR C-terminal-related transcriptional regulator [Streptomyces sp. NPDC006208]|uniref:LuxR family transcriptional regulator n=1 Tax=Streptomyces sp. NPDC006208 TaxID=3156734 RepID=UPI0033A028A8